MRDELEGDPWAERKKREWQREDKSTMDEALKALVSLREGRKLVARWLEDTHAIASNPFTGNALTTAFSCGEQNFGQRLIEHMIEVAPSSFLEMLKEYYDERNARDAILANRRAELEGRSSFGGDEDTDG